MECLRFYQALILYLTETIQTINDSLHRARSLSLEESERKSAFNIALVELSSAIQISSSEYFKSRHQIYMKFSDQVIASEFSHLQGLSVFLFNLIEKLTDRNFLKAFYLRVLAWDTNQIQKIEILLARMQNLSEESEKSYYIFRTFGDLLKTSTLLSKWSFWLKDYHNIASLSEKWKNDFKELMMNDFFLKFY